MTYLLIILLFSMSACAQNPHPVSPADTAHHQVDKLNRTGVEYHSAGDKTKALEHHNKALQLAKKHELHEDQIRSLIGIANVLKTDDTDQSIIHLKRALQLAKSINHQELTSEIYHSLSEIYRQQADYRQSMDALEEHHRLADKMIQGEKDQKLTLLEKTYQRDAILIIAIAILFIMAVLFYYFRKTRQLNTRLHAANQIKDKLFTIIGHDLRNPIGSITNVLAMMEGDDLTPDEQRHMISQMRKQGDVSLEILDSLLNWGKAQLNGITINPVEFDPTAIVINNITALQGKAAEKGLNIQNHILPGYKIKADQDHFDFIIRNLLSNAIKFSSESGKIEINVKQEPSRTVFSVKDEGVGINAAQQKAFLSQHMGITYGTKGEKGTGIGLMLSKEFQRASGGALWLESKEASGTTVYFSYPK
ncbi:ATP-binding protein [Pedobacter hiemivivus]|uniref:histidine kinase n=1 Tax=Pedobacter hiemivivus TaxID=2530454 RepID=A0A4R0MXK9_9SPHI|nr:tetratricopeptide repeat-containing sensor histidine kinase [Pedobacter hiemivivus]TCC91002.1 sensor histidine kinase [Pedobacter hiemivivus]